MILLTGATGLVGAHAALFLLQKGESVRAIFRTGESMHKTRALFKLYEHDELFEQIDWICADVLDIPALETAYKNVREVWHCAALISFDRNDEEKMRKINIEGTANLVNLAVEFKINKFCFVSSIAALGQPKKPNDIVDEELEWNPEQNHSDYAISKHGAEMEVWRGQQEGLQTVIVNPGVILGPGFWNQGSGAIFSAIADDLPFYTKGSTGFVAVTDLVEIMYKLMRSDINGQRYAIVAENIIFRDLSFMIADALNVKRPSIHAKPWMTEISWMIDYLLSKLIGKKRKLYRDTARSLHSRTSYSSQKIKSTLDFKFTDIKTFVNQVTAVQQKRTIT